ncbi:MAG: glycerol kinase GlpK [Maricaulaceae bacterium]
MPEKNVILSIDQGTTSSRTLVFSEDEELLFTAQKAFDQIYPQDGWVEHDPEAIWDTVVTTLRDAVEFCKSNGHTIKAAAITNQRETTLVWDRQTGKPLYNAIVWQDRRTAATCDGLKDKGVEDIIRHKTGLLLDPYFSASKIDWILDHVDGARQKAAQGGLAFGTVDSFLIWRLTGGKMHATDATNASRTSLFNIRTHEWDEELLTIFDVPKSLLPVVKDCADDFGIIAPDIIDGNVPIRGVAGDQQSALIGQGCFNVGELKSTYGTGCFIVTNTGDEMIESSNNLLTTIGYRLKGKTTYALEGSIFVAGAAIQWLRDGLELFDDAKATEALAKSAEDSPDLYLVPAFTGLGAPYWDPYARGAVFGLTRAANRADLVRAALEGIAFQTQDLLAAMAKDGVHPTRLRVDGGMVANDWFIQTLANVTNTPVDRPNMLETTALGAARLAIISLTSDTGINTPNVEHSIDMMTKKVTNWSPTYRTDRLSKWALAIKATRIFAAKP